MMGELKTWHEFLQADSIDLMGLPRRQLKAGASDVKRRLAPGIQRFCRDNFAGLNPDDLAELYDDIKAYRGLEMPLSEFEQEYGQIKPNVLRGNPAHLTICISLWGLQMKFPEDELVKDLVEAVRTLRECDTDLGSFKKRTHTEIEANRAEVQKLLRQRNFAARAALVCCFNLMEAYLNGIAWDFMQSGDTSRLSNRKRKLLEDSGGVSFRDKLLKYPAIVSESPLCLDGDPDVSSLLDDIKPVRDSLVHPSPFSAPERFGGYDKLRLFYRIESDIAETTSQMVLRLPKRIHFHVSGQDAACPPWLQNAIDHVL